MTEVDWEKYMRLREFRPAVSIDGEPLDEHHGVQCDPPPAQVPDFTTALIPTTSFRRTPPPECWLTKARYDQAGHVVGWDRLERIAPGRLIRAEYREGDDSLVFEVAT